MDCLMSLTISSSVIFRKCLMKALKKTLLQNMSFLEPDIDLAVLVTEFFNDGFTNHSRDA